MASVDMNKLRRTLNEHQYEIAAELGLGEGSYGPASRAVPAGETRNANADPTSPFAARTGRVTTKADLGLE